MLLGVRAVLAESYERIHLSNLVGMGIVPLEFMPGENAELLGLTGKEQFSINIPSDLKPGDEIKVAMDTGQEFRVLTRFDTDIELVYFKHGGILNYMIRQML
ncbi:Cytoplasmic aconitate hydratase-like [Oopsacas minuta]|uniref:Cytoplasmic aconitate hydratase-like n=1 Tax=Oopsacas minuta TaxID=111878 RepID=A0AAV7K2X4_9METZ|nr:Cytoplasmic aconitate hydratase-like [Oopsacas minuta]